MDWTAIYRMQWRRMLCVSNKASNEQVRGPEDVEPSTSSQKLGHASAVHIPVCRASPIPALRHVCTNLAGGTAHHQAGPGQRRLAPCLRQGPSCTPVKTPRQGKGRQPVHLKAKGQRLGPVLQSSTDLGCAQAAVELCCSVYVESIVFFWCLSSPGD